MRLEGKVLLLLADDSGEKAPPSGFVSNEHAIALECAREGAAVMIASIEGAVAGGIRDAVAKEGGKAASTTCDVRDEQSCRDAVRAAVARFGGLHLLVNTVGVADMSNVLDLSREAFATGLSLNVTGHFLGLKAAIPEIARAGGGAVVNVSSLSALRSGGAGIGYESGKAGLLAMTRHTAVSAAAQNIRVNSVLPGVIDSSAFRALVGDSANTFAGRIPLGRLGTPWDFAKAIAFLLSEDASYVTGATLLVDGGMSIGV